MDHGGSWWIMVDHGGSWWIMVDHGGSWWIMVHKVARALGAECALLERHVLLGLGVEGRVFDEAVDEDLASEWQASKRASR